MVEFAELNFANTRARGDGGDGYNGKVQESAKSGTSSTVDRDFKYTSG